MRAVLRNYVLLFLVVACFDCNSADISFSFNFSANINVGQSARYHCSVNSTNLSIIWFINGDADYDTTNIVVTKGGSPSSNLTILGLPQYNNTEVKCSASGYLQGNSLYHKSKRSTLRIQGQLAAVSNLSCKQDCPCVFGLSPTNQTNQGSSFTLIDSSGPVTPFISGSNCVQCHWDPPFSLTPIPGYIYNVTNKDSGNTTSITNTDYKYCPSQYGQHSFSVAANNTVGQGIVTRETVDIPTCNTLHLEAMNGTWTVKFFMNAACLNRSFNYGVALRLNDNEIIRNGSGYFDDNDRFVGTVPMGAVKKNRWTVSISLSTHFSKLLISTLGRISTYSIYNAEVEVKRDTICFTVKFVEGINTQSSMVTYKCNNANLNGRLLISRENGTNCTGAVEPNIYTIIFFDGETIYKEMNTTVTMQPSSSVNEVAGMLTVVLLAFTIIGLL